MSTVQNPAATIPPRAGSLINVIIDTPRGCSNKYKYDEELGIFRISRILPAGMHFPYDFGSVPGTCAEDGDPLDVLVLLDSPTFPGCLITARLIGGLKVQQREGQRRIRNDRLIAMPETPVNKPEIRSIRELSDAQLREIEQFFVSYNRVQGRELKVTSRFTAAAAAKILSDSIARAKTSQQP